MRAMARDIVLKHDDVRTRCLYNPTPNNRTNGPAASFGTSPCCSAPRQTTLALSEIVKAQTSGPAPREGVRHQLRASSMRPSIRPVEVVDEPAAIAAAPVAVWLPSAAR
jgi:hypothetical protein